MTKADRILSYYKSLDFDRSLLDGDLDVLNPFAGASPAQEAALQEFYRKFYGDERQRELILGINPGRLGAGATGIPFTDTKRLIECGIPFDEFATHEQSAEFFYQMLDAFGGARRFYRKFFVGSVCPLGFVARRNGNWVNFNYYERARFAKAITPYLLGQIREQLELAGRNERIIVFGKGENFKFLQNLNKTHGFTPALVPLEHPRYIIQYKRKQIGKYIAKYLEVFNR